MEQPMTDAERTDALLRSLVGEWEGTTKTWFEPGVLADESPIRGTIRAVPGSRFVVHEYQGSMNGESFHGLTLYGLNVQTGQVESAWVDSFHMSTNIMVARGAATSTGFAVLGSYGLGDGSPDWGWRTEIEVTGPEEIVITAYNILPTSEEAKALETRYRRLG